MALILLMLEHLKLLQEILLVSLLPLLESLRYIHLLYDMLNPC